MQYSVPSGTLWANTALIYFERETVHSTAHPLVHFDGTRGEQWSVPPVRWTGVLPLTLPAAPEPPAVRSICSCSTNSCLRSTALLAAFLSLLHVGVWGGNGMYGVWRRGARMAPPVN